MAGVMHANPADACTGAPGVKAPVEVARFDRGSPGGGEYQAEVMPGLASRLPSVVVTKSSDSESCLATHLARRATDRTCRQRRGSASASSASASSASASWAERSTS